MHRTTHTRPRRALVLSVLFLLLVCASGCEDDSDLGLGVSCITFVPDAVPTPGEVVARVGAESTCDVVVVELVVTGVADVFSASFEIDYPQDFSVIAENLDLLDSFLGDDLIDFLEEVPPGGGVAEGGVTRVGVENGGITPNDDCCDDTCEPEECHNLLLKLGFLRFVSSGSGALSINDANLQIVVGGQLVAADPAIPFRGGTLMIIDQLP